MKSLFVAATMAIASPVFAQSAEPACPHCEQAEMDCCAKDEDGKKRCRMMDHAKMDHGQMQHGQVDHGSMNHGAMNHGDHATHSANTPD